MRKARTFGFVFGSALTLFGAATIAAPAAAPEAKGGKEPAKTAPAAAPATAGKTIQMAVTDKGFEPANLTVKKGEPVTLAITRKTQKTCATEIVIDEEGINTKLPLNQEVKVSFTPKKAGTLKFGCGMGKMIGGVLKVE